MSDENVEVVEVVEEAVTEVVAREVKKPDTKKERQQARRAGRGSWIASRPVTLTVSASHDPSASSMCS
jgi:hypothetical protein